MPISFILEASFLRLLNLKDFKTENRSLKLHQVDLPDHCPLFRILSNDSHFRLAFDEDLDLQE